MDGWTDGRTDYMCTDRQTHAQIERYRYIDRPREIEKAL